MSATRAISVLVVDDDPRVRAALMRLLDDTGDLQVAALDTEQAARLCALTGLGTDVAVVDVAATSTRGADLVRLLSSQVQVVAVGLSASARLDALGAGACSFLEKDGDDAALIAAIRGAAARAPVQNEAPDHGRDGRPLQGGEHDGRRPHR